MYLKCAGLGRRGRTGRRTGFADVAGLGLTVLLAEPCSTNDSHRSESAARGRRAHKQHLVQGAAIIFTYNL